MKFALLVFYAAGTLAAPVVKDESMPRADVKEMGCSLTRFRRDTTFEYEYSGETINMVAGTTQQSTGLRLNARVLITPLENCEFHMQVQGVEFLSKSATQEGFMANAESANLKNDLEKNALIFEMKGTSIAAIRPHNDERTDILNIKRGILSNMQLDETTTTEADVNGVCGTTITKEEGKVVKTKDLSGCEKRAQNEIGIQFASFNTQLDLTPLKSKSKCTYVVDSDVIRTITCEESHLFRPFSAGYKTQSGAMTHVKQNLRLKGYTKDAKVDFDTHYFNAKSNLVYAHVADEMKQAETLNTQVEDVMNRLVDQAHLSAKPSAAHEFTSLVLLLRKMSQTKMRTVWNKYFDCIASKACGPKDTDLQDLYRQYMLDAIAYCGTPSCVSVVKDYTISGDIAGERANMFLQSIALVGKTTNGMIRDVLDIAEEKPSRQVFLTLGTLVSRHCAKSPADCVVQAGSPVTQVENFLEKMIGDDCAGQENHERVEEILMTLKAIGNAKRPTNARSALIRCGKNAIHTNITMAAFEALRGMPCDANVLDELRHVIKSPEIDADKRIYAFTASMKCPTADNLKHLVHDYNLEKNKQLSSFMWSYITNLMESNDPANKDAQEILKTITAETPLAVTNLPMYKYSKNFEKSLHLDYLKTGATAKANVVFHPDGFLPKTAMFDMTAKIMGVPVDLVETAVGVDGVETLLENVFGPGGSMPNDFVFNLFNWTVTAEKFREMAQQKEEVQSRERRSTEDKVEEIHNTVNKKPVQPSGFLSLKVMGQEVRMMSYDDIYAMIDQIDNMNVIQLLLNVARGGHKTFSKSMMFLEMTHTVPTGLGLPLKLKLTGSTVATVELDGKFDIRNMFWGPSAMTINGHVKPTAVVDISGKMGVESNYASSGLFVTSNMLVSNIMKGGINYKEGKILKINLDTPSEPVQLFKFSSTPYMYMNEQIDMIKGVPRFIEKDNCLKSELIGYGLCTSLRIPLGFRDYETPFFPLTGAAHVGVTLVRGDPKLTTYQFLMSMVKKPTAMEGLIELSTPGATYERKLNGKMSYTGEGNNKVLTLSTERYGKTGSAQFTYDTVTRGASIEMKNNFFTSKQVVAQLNFFNQTNEGDKEFGIKTSLAYDTYKLEHITKYMRTVSGYMLHSKTGYHPDKFVSAVLDYNVVEKTLTARVEADQFKQAVEVSGKLENTAEEKGVTITVTHVPTGKLAVVYAGYKGGENQKELMTSVNLLGLKKTMKNVLGYYKKGDIHSIENFFLYDDKTAKFVVAFENKDAAKSLKFTADILGKQAMSTVIYTDNGDKKFVTIRMGALGMKAGGGVEITMTDVEKSIKMTGTAADRNVQTVLGYYNTNDITVFKVSVDVLGRHGEAFWKIQKAEGYRSTLGVMVDNYIGGVRGAYTTEHGKGNSLCTSVYYGTTDAEKEPITACLKMKDLNTETMMHKKLVVSVVLNELKKTIEMVSDFKREIGHVNIAFSAVYDEKVLAMNTLDVEFKDRLNSHVEFETMVGKMKGGFKVYRKKEKDSVDFGVKVYGLDKYVLFLNQYRATVEPEAKEMQLTSSIIVNGKPLPVSTVVSYLKGAGVAGPTVSINIGKYSLIQSAKVTYGKKYGLYVESMLTKEEGLLFKLFNEISAINTPSKKEIQQKFGFSVLGKTYKYGWEVEYENMSTEKKRAVALIARVQYANNRKSAITVTVADSPKSTQMMVEVEYIPTKKVMHTIRYSKVEKQLEVKVEFLPKMFVTFLAKLETELGYRLFTNVFLEWKNYKQAVSMVNSYKNNDEMFVVTTSLGKATFISLKYNKMSPKSLTLSTSFMGNTGDIMVEYKDLGLKVLLKINGKDKFVVRGSYDKIAKSVRVIVTQAGKVIGDISTGYNKFMKAYKLAVAGAKQLFNINVNRKQKHATTISFYIMGERYVKIIVNKKTKSLSIQFRRDISFNFNYLPTTKSITMLVKSKTIKGGVILRADWKNLVLALHGIFNENKFGVKAFIEKNALVFKFIASPELSLKTTFTFKNYAIKMHVQRVIGKKVTSEASFQYKLSKELSEFIFKWNTETLKEITDLIRPLVNTAVKEMKVLTERLYTKVGELKDLSENTRESMVKLLKKMDKSFDDFDFVAARDQVGAAVVKALKKLSETTTMSLTAIANVLDNVKTNMPDTLTKMKELITKMKVVATKAKAIIAKTNKLLKAMKIDAEKTLNEIKKVVMTVAQNLTDSSKPVIETAITLLKDFKIRGQRLEDIVAMIQKDGMNIANDYVKKVAVKAKELRGKAMESLEEVRAYLMKMKIPYREETVEKVVELIMAKLEEIKQKIMNTDVQKLTAEMKMKLEELVTDLRTKIMDFKLKGKKIEEYIELIKETITGLRGEMKDVPEKVRKALHELVTLTRAYIKDADRYVKLVEEIITKLTEFAEPLTTYVTLVVDSLEKHFGPLYKKAINRIVAAIKSVEMPDIKSIIDAELKKIEDFILPLLRPIIPLMKNIKNQVREFDVMGFRVGTVVDMKLNELEDRFNDLTLEAKEKMNAQMVVFKNYVEKVRSSSADEMIDKSLDTVLTLSNDIVAYLNKLYTEREEMTKKTKEFVEELYKKLQTRYQKMKTMSIEDMLETIVKRSSNSITMTAGELSSIIKQIAAMDIATPSIEAWQQADVLGHLAKYGVNEKLAKIIELAKSVDLAETVEKTVKRIEEFVQALRAGATIRTMKVYTELKKVVDYIKSIPKKDYETWLNELETFTIEKKDDLLMMLTTIYEISRERAVEAYKKMGKFAKNNYDQIYKDYVVASKEWYSLIIQRSQLVYNDVKQPTIDVFNHYKTIGVDFVEGKYNYIIEQLKAEILKIYNELEARVEDMKVMLINKVEALKNQLETMYTDFLTKYGDMTWEEVGEKGVQLATENFEKLRKEVVLQYEKVVAQVMKMKADITKKTLEVYNKAIAEYKKVVTTITTKYEEIKPKVIEAYKKYREMAETEIANLKEEVKMIKVKVEKMLADVKAKVTDVYNQNKDKTLKQIYTEIKDYILNLYNKEMADVKQLVEKKLTLVKEVIAEVRTKAMEFYKKTDTMLRTVILPEIMTEAESIINQTLRATVIITKEAVKAFTPHAILVKDFIEKYTAVVKAEVELVIAKSKESIKLNLVKLANVMKKVVEDIEKSEIYVKLVNSKLIAIVKQKIMELKKLIEEKVEELKTHPTFVKAKEQIEAKIAEFKKMIKEYETILKKYYNDPRVVKVIDLLKQLQTSGEFSVEKLRETFTPIVVRNIKMIKRILEELPGFIKEAVDYFYEQPEVAFWSGVRVTKDVVKETYKFIKSINKEMIVREIEFMYNLVHRFTTRVITTCTDDWTKETCKTIINDLNTFVSKLQMKLQDLKEKIKELPVVLKELYAKNMMVVTDTIKKQVENLKKIWEDSPFKAIVDNPIWGELIDEVRNHELVDLAKEIVEMGLVKVTELKKVLATFYTEKMALLKVKLEDLKLQLKELRTTLVGKYNDIQGKITDLYEKIVANIEKIVAKGKKIFEETTVAEMVDFVQKKYVEVLGKVKELKKDFDELKLKYTEEVKALYNKYEKVVKEMYTKAYDNAMKMIAEYKAKVIPYVEEVKAKVMELYNKYEPIVVAKYEEMKVMLEAKYNEIKAKAEAKFAEIKKIVEEKLKELKEKSMALYKQYKTEVMTLTKKIVTDVKQKWMDSELRKKIMALKKMTIRETIEALKKLPEQTKEYLVATYTKLKKEIVDTIEKIFKDLIGKLKLQQQKLKALFTDIEKMMTPLKELYEKIVKELRETAIFFYKYYGLREKYEKVRQYVTMEMERIAPMITAILKKYAAIYKSKAAEYVEKYKELTGEYARDAREYARTAGDKTLKGIHIGLKYIDDIDVENMKNKVKDYVSVTRKNGEVVVKITHPDVMPNIKYHLERVRRSTKKTMNQLKVQGQEMLEKIKEELAVLKEKAEKLREQIQKQVMENSAELRRDIKVSYKANKNIAKRIYNDVKTLTETSYERALVVYDKVKRDAVVLMDQAKSMAKVYYKELMTRIKDAYLKASAMVLELSKLKPTELYNKLVKFTTDYYKLLETNGKEMLKTYKPIVEKTLKRYLEIVKERGLELQEDMKPYYASIKTAYNQLKAGVPVKEAIKPIIDQLKFNIKFNFNVREMICKEDKELCELVESSMELHKILLKKYVDRLRAIYMIAKGRLDRIIRQVGEKTKKTNYMGQQYTATAMVLDDKYMLTFDNKFYEFVDVQGEECSYLLARDFMNKKFTVKKIYKGIVIETPDMAIRINKDGTTKTTYGNKVSKSLPVEVGASQCVRLDNLIICDFKAQAMKVTIDLKHFFTTISVSGWYQGKSQGLLGTFNFESQDDWKLPNNKITNNINEFANAYELSGSPKCQLDLKKDHKKTCDMPPSRKCHEIFAAKTSPYAEFFTEVNPSPFMEACKLDTRGCDGKPRTPKMHCNVAAAYVAVLRTKGVWASQLPRCMQERGRALNEEWIQKPVSKAIDIVVMISMRKSMAKNTKRITTLLYQMHKMLTKAGIKHQFALIGFGGEGVHEPAHIHPLRVGKTVFGYVLDMKREILSMPFTGVESSNDAYHAIMAASRLRFRPGVEKAFLLFNSEPHVSHESGPSYEEALYILEKESDAALFVFDDIHFASLGENGGRIIGQTERKMYTTKNLQGIANKDLGLPVSEFREMALVTKGGLFSSKIKDSRKTAISLNDAVFNRMQVGLRTCKRCTLKGSWTGEPRPVCVSDNNVTC